MAWPLIALAVGLVGCSGSTTNPSTPQPMWTQGQALQRDTPGVALESLLKASAAGQLDLCPQNVEMGASSTTESWDETKKQASQVAERAAACGAVLAALSAGPHGGIPLADIKVKNLAFPPTDSTALIRGGDIEVTAASGYTADWGGGRSYFDPHLLFTLTKQPDGWYLTDIGTS